jgi:hypothetical protein
MADRPTWRDRYPEEVTCVRCLEPRDLMEVDRLLWCDRCRRIARDRAGWWGWAIGLAFGAGVAAYVWIAIRPTDLVIGGWVATVVAGVWIASKVGRELSYGVMRFRNTHAADAAPPGPPPDDAPR